VPAQLRRGLAVEGEERPPGRFGPKDLQHLVVH
jgi:hypothetical protein